MKEKKAANELRKHTVSTSVTEGEYADICKLAAEKNMTKSNMLRKWVLAGLFLEKMKESQK